MIDQLRGTDDRDLRLVDPSQYSFAICFCTRSRPCDLERALLSIARSTVPVAQVVVSDDSVDEETARLVARCFPEVIYLQGPRRGLGANRNCAVVPVTSTHVVYMDDDTALGARFIESIVDAYQAVEPELRRTTIISGLENLNGKLVEPSDLSFWGFVDQPRTPANVRPLQTAVINATSFPRWMFPNISFDENLIYGSEEVDICTQAIAKGYRFQLCHQAINDHYQSTLNRDQYAKFVTASRIYSTLKRYFFLERSPAKGAVYLLAGPLKLAVSAMLRKGFRGFADVIRSTIIAAGYCYLYLKPVVSSKDQVDLQQQNSGVGKDPRQSRK